ncbi:MAG: hypothetical protein NWQ29_03250, partial [Alphaproteobacteria bacterium]|nr:hypothetical protein [Alphaproteobacteria bacterium]
MNNLFSILLFSIILLTKVDAALEYSSSESQKESLLNEQLKKQIAPIHDGLKLVEQCMQETKNLWEHPDRRKHSTALTRRLICDTLIYKKLEELTQFFLSTQEVAEKKTLADHIAIISAAHFSLPYPAGIKIKKKLEIKEKLGVAKSLSAEYFINCLEFREYHNQFGLSQFPAIEESELLIFQRKTLQIREGLIPFSTQKIQKITEIEQLIKNIETLLTTYFWGSDDFFTNFQSVAKIYEELVPNFLTIQEQLILFNQCFNYQFIFIIN